jgi:hypothetical protein
MMKLPVIEGIIRRRILVNYRVDPSVVQRMLPPAFRPKLHAGYAVAGVCLIRLEHIRPRMWPQFVGTHSENAAHRIAVVWDDENGIAHEGVFISRRDTSSRLNHWLGGRFFPGEHQRASFQVIENGPHLALSVQSHDRAVDIGVEGRVADSLPRSSIFSSLDDASSFFASGSLGYSVTQDPHRLDGIELRTREWQVRPLDVTHVHSSYFDDQRQFPRASAEFDHALLMKDVRHEWHAADDLWI